MSLSCGLCSSAQLVAASGVDDQPRALAPSLPHRRPIPSAPSAAPAPHSGRRPLRPLAASFSNSTIRSKNPARPRSDPRAGRSAGRRRDWPPTAEPARSDRLRPPAAVRAQAGPALATRALAAVSARRRRGGMPRSPRRDPARRPRPSPARLGSCAEVATLLDPQIRCRAARIGEIGIVGARGAPSSGFSTAMARPRSARQHPRVRSAPSSAARRRKAS